MEESSAMRGSKTLEKRKNGKKKKREREQEKKN